MRVNGDGIQVQMLSFEVPVNVKRRLESCAHELGSTTSDVLRTLIDQHLKDLSRGARQVAKGGAR